MVCFERCRDLAVLLMLSHTTLHFFANVLDEMMFKGYVPLSTILNKFVHG